MKILWIIALAVLIPGCAFNVAWRGTLTYVEQQATTDGRVESKPVTRDTSIAAEKTTDLQAEIPLK